MKNTKDYQKEILTELCTKEIPCTIFLMNGFQMRGILTAFDTFMLVIEVDGRQQIIYKHAISTITPHGKIETITR